MTEQSDFGFTPAVQKTHPRCCWRNGKKTPLERCTTVSSLFSNNKIGCCSSNCQSPARICLECARLKMLEPLPVEPGTSLCIFHTPPKEKPECPVWAGIRKRADGVTDHARDLTQFVKAQSLSITGITQPNEMEALKCVRAAHTELSMALSMLEQVAALSTTTKRSWCFYIKTILLSEIERVRAKAWTRDF